jgi:hypothetical protein
MTGKQFFDWQTSGGTDDVMRLVDCLERADVPWCCIGGVAVNHWAEQQMVTRDVDLVIALDAVERVVRMLAPPTQGSQLGRSGPLANVHAARSEWRRRTVAV